MRNCYKILITVLLLLISVNAVAQYSKWQCSSYDASHRRYVVVSNTLQSAMKQSFQMCLQISPYKRSCTISAAYCKQKIEHHGYHEIGHYRHHGRRCVVTDARGRGWVVRGHHACQRAIHQCKQWHYAHGIPNGGICIVR